jgi:hypothetical protein
MPRTRRALLVTLTVLVLTPLCGDLALAQQKLAPIRFGVGPLQPTPSETDHGSQWLRQRLT